jgi:hypothetical protein
MDAEKSPRMNAPLASFENHLPRRVITGRGASESLVDLCRANGWRRAFIVSDAGVAGAGLLRKVSRPLLEAQLLADTFAEVRPGERLVCTLDPAEPLEPRLHVPTPTSWSADFTQQPSRLNGIWLPPSTEHPRGAFAAQPLIAAKQADGGVTIHHGIIWQSETGFVSLTPKSAIHLKVRTSSPAELQLILSTRMADGTYAGNFEASPLPVPPLAPGQWHELQFTLADFVPTQLDHPQPERGAIVQGIILNSYQRDVSLEISALEFTQ